MKATAVTLLNNKPVIVTLSFVAPKVGAKLRTVGASVTVSLATLLVALPSELALVQPWVSFTGTLKERTASKPKKLSEFP